MYDQESAKNAAIPNLLIFENKLISHCYHYDGFRQKQVSTKMNSNSLSSTVNRAKTQHQWNSGQTKLQDRKIALKINTFQLGMDIVRSTLGTSHPSHTNLICASATDMLPLNTISTFALFNSPIHTLHTFCIFILKTNIGVYIYIHQIGLATNAMPPSPPLIMFVCSLQIMMSFKCGFWFGLRWKYPI